MAPFRRSFRRPLLQSADDRNAAILSEIVVTCRSKTDGNSRGVRCQGPPKVAKFGHKKLSLCACSVLRRSTPNALAARLQKLVGEFFLISSQQVLNPTPLNPTPATCHKRKQKLRCNFGMLRCRSCTATFAFLQCGCHFGRKLRCSKRKTAVQHWKSCVARKWRFPAAFLRISSSHG